MPQVGTGSTMTQILEQYLTDQRLLRDEDVRALFGWTQSTFEARVARAQMPKHIRKGGLRLWDWETMTEWLKNDVPITPYASARDFNENAASDLLK